MRAIKVIKTKDYSTLSIVHCDEPKIPLQGSGNVLVRVFAAGVNHADVLQRKGYYPPPTGASDILGLELSGEIIGGDLSSPSNIFDFKVGNRICALVSGGAYAEYCICSLGQCLPIPNNLSNIEAASLPETYFTVWSNFNHIFLKRNTKELLLVHGGTGGIGTTAIQIATAMGHSVIATVRNEEKAKACLKLGSIFVINYFLEDFVERIHLFTKKRGVNIVLDIIGGSYFQRNLDCLSQNGKLILIGLQNGRMTTLNCLSILNKNLTIFGSTLRSQSIEYKFMIARSLKEHIWPLFESRIIHPMVYRTFFLENAIHAHNLMESSQHIGKIILTI